MIKVTVVDVVTEEFEKRWREDLDGLPIELELIRDSSEAELTNAVAGASVLITRHRRVDEALLKAAGETLEMVIKLSQWRIGIDEQACAAKDVTVVNVPQLGCITVAEHAMSLLLVCARDMINSHLGVVNGDYRNHGLTPAITSERSFAFKWLPVMPLEVYGKTIGIVGFGEIGKELAVRARAFGMRIIYHDVRRASPEIEEALVAEFLAFPNLLEEADFISLHIPHTAENEKLIGAEQLKRMKNSAFLINACRGGVVDEGALVKSLERHEIAGAGLDVFVEEPLPHDHPLTTLDNVVLTPHIGGGSGSGRAYIAQRVRKYVSGLLL